MTEADLFKRLKKATPGFDWTRHEDKLVSGIPDCSYGALGVGGWVELKSYDCWPRSASQPLRFHNLKPTQVNWAIRRGRKQRRVWFLVAVGGSEWFLIRWMHARELGRLTRQELLDKSDMSGSFPMSKEISQIFTQGNRESLKISRNLKELPDDPNQPGSRARTL